MPVKAKPPVSAWIQSERKRMGWKVADLSRRLIDLGYDAQESTVGVWEAGRSPKAETIEAMERLFGSQAPREDGHDGSALVDALRIQTDLLTMQWQATVEHTKALSFQTDALTRIAEEAAARPTQDLEALVALTVETTVRALAAQGLLAIPSRRSRQRVTQG